VFDIDKLWKNGSVLHVQFLDSPNVWKSWQKAWIALTVKQHIEVNTNLTFQFHIEPSTVPLNKRCEIRITYDPYEGSYSYLGVDSIDPSLINSMGFGWMDAPYSTTFVYEGRSYTTPFYFDRGGYSGLGATIVHEFCHALGMLHELESPYNNPLVWDKPATYAYFGDPNGNNWSKEDVDYNLLNQIEGNINGSSFDRNSIMKYALPAKLLIKPTPSQVLDIQQLNQTLSECDKYWLSLNYPGKNVAPLCTLGKHNAPVVPTPTPLAPFINPTPLVPVINPTPLINPTPIVPVINPTPMPPINSPTPTPTPSRPHPTPIFPMLNQNSTLHYVLIFIGIAVILYFLYQVVKK
jgi:hypothetical protein